eukprot:11726630-Alexandrium_andersonii.AAC.1
MVAAARAGPGPTCRAPGAVGVRTVDLEPGLGHLQGHVWRVGHILDRVPSDLGQVQCGGRQARADEYLNAPTQGGHTGDPGGAESAPTDEASACPFWAEWGTDPNSATQDAPAAA